LPDPRRRRTHDEQKANGRGSLLARTNVSVCGLSETALRLALLLEAPDHFRELVVARGAVRVLRVGEAGVEADLVLVRAVAEALGTGETGRLGGAGVDLGLALLGAAEPASAPQASQVWPASPAVSLLSVSPPVAVSVPVAVSPPGTRVSVPAASPVVPPSLPESSVTVQPVAMSVPRIATASVLTSFIFLISFVPSRPFFNGPPK
jgi:hypothetical protein